MEGTGELRSLSSLPSVCRHWEGLPVKWWCGQGLFTWRWRLACGQVEVSLPPGGKWTLSALLHSQQKREGNTSSRGLQDYLRWPGMAQVKRGVVTGSERQLVAEELEPGCREGSVGL